MALSRMTYNAVASMIAGERKRTEDKGFGSIPRFFVLETTRNLAVSMANLFSQDNPRFSRERFMEVCGIADEHHRQGGNYSDPDTGEDF